MNALLDYLETHPKYGLYGLSTVLCSSHALRAIHGNLSGHDTLHLSRKTNDSVGDDNIYNDTTLTILDANMNVVGMAPPLSIKLNNKEVDNLPLSDENPAVVSELLIGKLVVVSLYENTFVISTKDSLHASFPINGNTTVETREIFLDLLDRIDPFGGLDGLFRANRGGIDFRKFSYTFVLSPRGGKFTDNFLDYDMFLVALYDRTNHMFKTPPQIESLCQQLNGASTTRKIKLPTYEKVYSVKQLKSVARSYVSKPYVRGCYLLDDAMHSAYFLIKKEIKPNPIKYLRNIVKAYATMDYIAVLQENASNKHLSSVIRKFFSEFRYDANKKFKEVKDARTKRALHESVRGHKAAILLYALYEGRVTNVNELHRVFKINKLTRMLMEEYGVEYIEKLIEEQEAEKRAGNQE